MIQCAMITNESLCIHFNPTCPHFKTGCFSYTSIVNLTPVCFLIYGNKCLPGFFAKYPLNNNAFSHVFHGCCFPTVMSAPNGHPPVLRIAS